MNVLKMKTSSYLQMFGGLQQVIGQRFLGALLLLHDQANGGMEAEVALLARAMPSRCTIFSYPNG